MDKIEFTFKDARNPNNVSAHSKGMDGFLTRLLAKASITKGSFHVLLLNTTADMMVHKGIKLVSHDNKNSIRLKIWADVKAFDATMIIPSALGKAPDVFQKLSRNMNHKRIVTEEELFPAVLNPLVLPPVHSEVTVGQSNGSIEKIVYPPDVSVIILPVKVKTPLGDPTAVAMILDDLRQSAKSRIFGTDELRVSMLKVYNANEVFGKVSTMIGILIRRRYVERTSEDSQYRLTELADLSLVRHNLLAEDQIVKDPPTAPPNAVGDIQVVTSHTLTVDLVDEDPPSAPSIAVEEISVGTSHPLTEDLVAKDPPTAPPITVAFGDIPILTKAEKGDIPSSLTRIGDVENPLSGKLSKLQSVIGEISSVETALKQCEEKEDELVIQAEQIERQLEEVRASVANFKKILLDPKYQRAKALQVALEEYS